MFQETYDADKYETLHLLGHKLDLLHGQLHTADVVIAVEAAVDAVIFAVIGDI